MMTFWEKHGTGCGGRVCARGKMKIWEHGVRGYTLERAYWMITHTFSMQEQDAEEK